MSLIDKFKGLFQTQPPVFYPERCISNLKVAMTRISLQLKKLNALLSETMKDIIQKLSNSEIESAYNQTKKLLEIQSNIKALNVLNIVCETLLLGFDSIDTQSFISSEIEDAIYNLVYASARIDLKELKIISSQLKIKFGQDYIMDCLRNKGNKVDKRLIESLSLTPIGNDIVNRVFKHIAKENGFDIHIDEYTIHVPLFNEFNFDEQIPSFDNNNSNIDISPLNVHSNPHNNLDSNAIIEFPEVPDHEVIISSNQFFLDKITNEEGTKKETEESSEYDELMLRLAKLKQ